MLAGSRVVFVQRLPIEAKKEIWITKITKIIDYLD
jgi:hypothetical protein